MSGAQLVVGLVCAAVLGYLGYHYLSAVINAGRPELQGWLSGGGVLQPLGGIVGAALGFGIGASLARN